MKNDAVVAGTHAKRGKCPWVVKFMVSCIHLYCPLKHKLDSFTFTHSFMILLTLLIWNIRWRSHRNGGLGALARRVPNRCWKGSDAYQRHRLSTRSYPFGSSAIMLSSILPIFLTSWGKITLKVFILYLWFFLKGVMLFVYFRSTLG